VRAFIAHRWDEQAATVRRAFERLPVLGTADPAAAAVDLVALSLFLEGDDEFGSATDELGSAYRACITSALSLLPTHRGAMFREVNADEHRRAGLLVPGTVLAEPGPVSGRSLTVGRPHRPQGALFVIWSRTARILEPLRPGSGPAGGIVADDLMFVPGTRLVVLESVAGGWNGVDLILLQEVPEGGAVPSDPSARLLRTLDVVAARP
jgi:hypothetical protein